LLDDDFILEVPFNVSGTNDYSDIMHRIEQIKRQFKETWKFLVDIKYDEIDITSGNNTNNAFAETLGNMKLSTDGRYRNRYIFRFDAREGLLVRIREYTNPITSIKAWGERHSG